MYTVYIIGLMNIAYVFLNTLYTVYALLKPHDAYVASLINKNLLRIGHFPL